MHRNITASHNIVMVCYENVMVTDLSLTLRINWRYGDFSRACYVCYAFPMPPLLWKNPSFARDVRTRMRVPTCYQMPKQRPRGGYPQGLSAPMVG